MVEVTDTDRKRAWPFVPSYSSAGKDCAGFFAGKYDRIQIDGREIVEAFAAHRLAARAELLAELSEPFQARVKPWMDACFGEAISNDKVERGDRLLEEVFELLQSGGYDPARIPVLVEYVWNRPVGQPSQEAGGVMVTLAAYCLAHTLDMHEAGETELARIWTKVEQIRAKQAAKARDIPLSPLPSAP